MANLMIPGPVGKLECEELTPENARTDITAVICHPHPLQEGTMNNKVVTTLARTFRDLNIPSVRFNFRGVGKSEGEHDYAVGEVDDLLAVIDWVKKNNPNTELILAGFSFGAYIAACGAKQLNPKQLISIAPAVQNSDYASLNPMPCPWLVIMGEEDEVVSIDDVRDWHAHCDPQPQLITMAQTSHFFHGKLILLREHLLNYLEKRDPADKPRDVG